MRVFTPFPVTSAKKVSVLVAAFCMGYAPSLPGEVQRISFAMVFKRISVSKAVVYELERLVL